jgi:hypothetical protein
VQYLLHSLLQVFFDDVRPEEWTPSYAGRKTPADFLLKQERIIVEAKMTRENLKQKQVVEQLIVDRAHYGTHPDCDLLLVRIPKCAYFCARNVLCRRCRPRCQHALFEP